MTDSRILRMFIALAAGIVMGLVSSFVSYRASAAPLHHQVSHVVTVVGTAR